ncbi:hypothetical protein ACTMTJ_34380 [Phytohabitans sp. LJ34]|uniref:hypothetical protein n=1 Tax=Phytohabitans sp. LJ34 TaxID=3452217 RepID=UPI003F89B338
MPRGVALVMAAAVLWGTIGTAQAISGYDGSSLPLGSARLVVASLVLAGIAASRRVSWRQAFASRRTAALVLLGWLLPHEPVTVTGLVGAALVIAGLAITAIGRSPVPRSSP